MLSSVLWVVLTQILVCTPGETSMVCNCKAGMVSASVTLVGDDARKAAEECMKVMVIGVHRVDEAPEPCHLIELLVEGEGEFAVGSITQPNPTMPEANWQVPYDEYRLAPDGRSGEPLGFAPVDVHGHIHLALFFHYLSPTEPLRTPAGPVALPPVTPMPRRLRFMKYEPPC